MRYKDKEKMANIESFINEYYESSGVTPTIYDIAKEIGSAPSTVSRYLTEMENNGIVERVGRRKIITGKIKQIDDAEETVMIPVLGDIACGTPIFADGNINEYLSFPASFVGNGNHFLLTAKGDSMTEVGIDDGDLVLIRQQDHAESGQIVVALIDDEATLKRYYPEPKKHRIRLHAENSGMNDIYVNKCIVQGIAVKVIKNLN